MAQFFVEDAFQPVKTSNKLILASPFQEAERLPSKKITNSQALRQEPPKAHGRVLVKTQMIRHGTMRRLAAL